MIYNIIAGVACGLLLSACVNGKPFQPPPHPAELWVKQQYSFAEVLSEMKACGWIEPKDNLDSSGKINMNRYAQVEHCMRAKGFTYIGRTPLICQRQAYRNLPACQSTVQSASPRIP